MTLQRSSSCNASWHGTRARRAPRGRQKGRCEHTNFPLMTISVDLAPQAAHLVSRTDRRGGVRCSCTTTQGLRAGCCSPTRRRRRPGPGNFLGFVRHVRTGDVPDNIGGWLHRVYQPDHQPGTSRVRRSRKNRYSSIAPSRCRPRTSWSDRMSGRLLGALAELPADARTALLMAASGFSSTEIGDAINRTANATSTYICRARIAFANCSRRRGTRTMNDHRRILMLRPNQPTARRRGRSELNATSGDPHCRIAAGMRHNNVRLRAALAPVAARRRSGSASWLKRRDRACAPPRPDLLVGCRGHRCGIANPAADRRSSARSDPVGHPSSNRLPGCLACRYPNDAARSVCTGPFIVAGYTYTDQVGWHDRIRFRFDVGIKWSRTDPIGGKEVSYAGRNLRARRSQARTRGSQAPSRQPVGAERT